MKQEYQPLEIDLLLLGVEDIVTLSEDVGEDIFGDWANG